MKILNRLILLVSAVIAMPLHAADIDHSTMHHEHEQPSAEMKQQAQDHSMQHDQQGASQNNHTGHQSKANDQHHNHEAMQSDVQAGSSSSGSAAALNLPRLNALPPSGKSREANFDNTYFMHNTSLEQPLEVKCALATRGLIMLDNETFQKCGGKPVGWSKGITAAQTSDNHSQHMNH